MSELSQRQFPVRKAIPAAKPKPAVTQSVPPRAASTPPPPPPQFDVPTLIADIESGYKQLIFNAAGFASLNRAADFEESPDGPPSDVQPPIMSWMAGYNGKPVEVQTDLRDVPVDQRGPLFDILINLHGRHLLLSVQQIIKAAKQLETVLMQSANDVEQQQPASLPRNGNDEDWGESHKPLENEV